MRQGRRAAVRKKSKVPVILLVLILVAGVFAFFYLQDQQKRGGPNDNDKMHAEAMLAEVSAEPVEEPEPEPEPEPEIHLPGEGIRVCIDPGHGGRDPGTHNPNEESRTEKIDNMRLALAVQEKMEEQGIEVILTRANDDEFPSLMERCDIANKAKVNYFISLHRNFAEGNPSGIEVWKSYNASEESSTLADVVSAALEDAGVTRNRGVSAGSQDHNGDYAVLRATEMPGILIEMGFMGNEEDNKLFDDNMEAYAGAITQSVLDVHEQYHSKKEKKNSKKSEEKADSSAESSVH